MKILREFLVEMGNSRSKTEEKITHLSYQPLLHIVKILRYDDPINYNHHVSDINGWMQQIQVSVRSYIGKRLKPKHVLKWILTDHIGKSFESTFDRIEKYGNLKNYVTLSKLENWTEIEDKILIMYPMIVEDLITDEFTTIEKYL